MPARLLPLETIMDITATASVSTVPRHTADLRPAADAAALARQPQPHLPLGPAAASQPPQSGQVAAISRALLDTSDTSKFPPLKEPPRVLKPYGIEMLPHRPDDPPDEASASPIDREAAPEPLEDEAADVSGDDPDAVRPETDEASQAA